MKGMKISDFSTGCWLFKALCIIAREVIKVNENPIKWGLGPDFVMVSAL